MWVEGGGCEKWHDNMSWKRLRQSSKRSVKKSLQVGGMERLGYANSRTEIARKADSLKGIISRGQRRI